MMKRLFLVLPEGVNVLDAFVPKVVPALGPAEAAAEAAKEWTAPERLWVAQMPLFEGYEVERLPAPDPTVSPNQLTFDPSWVA